MSAGLDAIRQEIAEGCRVLAARDLAPGILGHISVRLGEDTLALRCRHPMDRGLAWTTSDDIRVVHFDGCEGVEGEFADGHVPPFELALHTAILRSRADVNCVVHAHPTSVVAADLAGIEIKPIIGAYDIPGAVIASKGVPVYPRSVLVHREQLGEELADHLGDKVAVVMRGHGLTVVGSSVPEAVLAAISINRIAQLSLDIIAAGGILREVSTADSAELPDLGAGLNYRTAWRHELSRLQAMNCCDLHMNSTREGSRKGG